MSSIYTIVARAYVPPAEPAGYPSRYLGKYSRAQREPLAEKRLTATTRQSLQYPVLPDRDAHGM